MRKNAAIQLTPKFYLEELKEKRIREQIRVEAMGILSERHPQPYGFSDNLTWGGIPIPPVCPTCRMHRETLRLDIENVIGWVIDEILKKNG